MSARVDAVLFDLDDTLFDQRVWLQGAWRAVASTGACEFGIGERQLFDALVEISAEGTDRGRIIDRALARVGLRSSPLVVEPLVKAFRAHRPPELPPYPGVDVALRTLGARVPLALVTDGDPDIQRFKLDALGLADAFAVVVLTDRLDGGRAARKPNPVGLLHALSQLFVEPEAAVYVGDRPDKDIAAAHAAGMRAIRVRTGEYRHVDNADPPWHDVPSAVAAATLLTTSILRVDNPLTGGTSTLRMQEGGFGGGR
ncbi:MAG: HAD family hydrolase [Acidimicrobiia bacterium]|nr:HAD family hydrolase [Acidimicrobiia bacterium]